MTYHGQIRNGVVVFDGAAPLAEGTRVRIEPEPVKILVAGTPGEELLRFQGLIDSASLSEMSEAIDRDCGKVDADEW
jgi:hypothetical protein